MTHRISSISIFFLVLAWTVQVQAQRNFSVPLGGKKILSLGGMSGTVKIGDTKIIKAEPYGGGLMISGKKIGETNVMVISNNGDMSWNIRVTMPSAAIQAELDKLFPDDRVEASALGGTIVLKGSVANIIRVREVESVVMGYLRSPHFADLGLEPSVINLLTVRSAQQVQLEVKFAEVNRRSFREIGANVMAVQDGTHSLTGEGAGTSIGGMGVGDVASGQVGTPADPTQPVRVGIVPTPDSFGTFFFGTKFGSFPFVATLSMLAQHNLSRTLAEPTLVAMSGESASFLAGGEIPFEKSNGLSDTTIEFKPFGVELTFNPTVLSDDTVQLKTSVSLSAPDPSFTLRSGGITTFAFKRRSSETTVRLKDGQSFAIAGLLKDELSKVTAEVPGLASIPIIGLLFKSKSFERQETELVVVVTARLVDPLEQSQLPKLPGHDGPTDPTDLQMFLLNWDNPKAIPKGKAQRRPSGTLGFSR